MLLLSIVGLLACVHRGDVIKQGEYARLVWLTSFVSPTVAEGSDELRLEADGTLLEQSRALGLPSPACAGSWRLRDGALEIRLGRGCQDGPDAPWERLAYIEVGGDHYLWPVSFGPVECTGSPRLWPGWRLLEGSIDLPATRVPTPDCGT